MKKGFSQTLCERCGMSVSSHSMHKHRAACDRVPDDILEIAETSGQTLKQLATRYGVGVPFLRNVLSSRGMPIAERPVPQSDNHCRRCGLLIFRRAGDMTRYVDAYNRRVQDFDRILRPLDFTMHRAHGELCALCHEETHTRRPACPSTTAYTAAPPTSGTPLPIW